MSGMSKWSGSRVGNVESSAVPSCGSDITGGGTKLLQSFGMSFPRAGVHIRLVLALPALWSCAETSAPLPPPEEVVVVLNTTAATLSLVPVATPSQVSTVPLGASDVEPVSVATRGATAVVPLRGRDAIAVVDLRAGMVLKTISLARGAGVAGAALINDSVAYVSNANFNTVTR